MLLGNDVGNPLLAGSTVPAGPNAYDLAAGGEDIWGSNDQFHFAHETVSGDFVCRVRVEAVQPVNLYTKAGIMVRTGLEADAAHVFYLVFPTNAPRNNNLGGYESQSRSSSGAPCIAFYPKDSGAEAGAFPVVFPHGWLKVARSGNLFEFWTGQNGSEWRSYGKIVVKLPRKVLVGLAVTSHSPDALCTARFRDYGLSNDPKNA